MTKDQLRHIFQSPFDSDNWQRMLLEIFGANRIRIVPQELDSDGNQKVQGYELGKILTPDGYTIGLYEFEIKFGHRIEMNRVGLRGLVKNFTGYFVDAALVVYHNREQWRLSFICDLQGEKTAPKRFTYVFCNPTETYRTAVDRIFPLADSDKSFDAIYDAFSVEKLSRDFFNEYKRQYKLFYDHLGGTEKWQRDYVKKLLGRLVFLQFLQKKGWLGADASAENKWKTGDRQYLQNLVRRHEGNEKFLSEVLSVLFFETLNNADRENEIADSILGANICIPYLNGGLFDRDESDLRHDIEFPYGLFRGLMEFFSHYNFTIDENDPDDSEVGIDPEMLGHIFENLLEDNKDKGAYYTPKEIVRYMSQESLIQYLRRHTEPERHEAVEQLVRNDKVDGIADKKFAERLNMLLKQVKVCDPAIGSGAFPMGILSEIYRCRRRLFGITDRSANRFDSADIKREIIQENIYGVDIEQGAVDIARLRFWLSLVVDEEKPQPLPNLDYKIMQGNSLLESFAGLPLDNLSEIHMSSVVQDLFSNDADVQFSEDIDRLTDDYFNTTDHVLKEELRNRIENQVKERIGYSINRQMEAKYETIEGLKRRLTANSPKSKYKVIERLERDYDRLLEKVAELPYITKDNRPYFLWHTYFKDVFDQGGFDIVIANPPYVEQQLPTDCVFKYNTRNVKELYAFFFELAICQLLKNNGGVLTFITASLYVKGLKFEPLRMLLQEYTNKPIIKYVGDAVFEKVNMPTCIYVATLGQESVWRMDDFIEDGTLIKKIQDNKIALGQVALIQRGLEVGKKQTNKLSEVGVDFITGEDVAKYRIIRRRKISEETLEQFRKHAKFYTGARVLIRETGSVLTSLCINEKLYCNRSLYVIKPGKGFLAEYITALLNSSLMQFYYSRKFKAETNIFPKIRIRQVKDLPIVAIPISQQLDYRNLVTELQKNIEDKQNYNSILSMIDRLVYQLYGLTEDEIAIIEENH